MLKQSKLFSINLADVGKSVLIAVLTPIFTWLAATIQDGQIPTGSELLSHVGAGLAAGFAYLCKNFLTNSENKIMKPEPKP
jgi:hypothetical protein